MQITQTEKGCSIQVPYLTGTDLVIYYGKFIRSQWVEPDYTEKPCEICGAMGCAGYHGFYTRTVIEPTTGFAVSDFPVMRFLCHRVGESCKSDDKTFSLLPVELVPFRKLSLLYMVLSVLIRMKRKLSLLKSLDVIAEELCAGTQDILFVHEPALTDHEMIMRLASPRVGYGSLLIYFQKQQTFQVIPASNCFFDSWNIARIIHQTGLNRSVVHRVWLGIIISSTRNLEDSELFYSVFLFRTGIIERI